MAEDTEALSSEALLLLAEAAKADRKIQFEDMEGSLAVKAGSYQPALLRGKERARMNRGVIDLLTSGLVVSHGGGVWYVTKPGLDWVKEHPELGGGDQG